MGKLGPNLSQNLQRLNSYPGNLRVHLLGFQFLLHRNPDHIHLGQGLASFILTLLPDASRFLLCRGSSQLDNLFGLLLSLCFYSFRIGIGFLPCNGRMLLDPLRTLLGLGYHRFGVGLGCSFKCGDKLKCGGKLFRFFRLLLSLGPDPFRVDVGCLFNRGSFSFQFFRLFLGLALNCFRVIVCLVALGRGPSSAISASWLASATTLAA